MNRDIVAVGASAGGVKALQELISDLPEDFGASILVVQHISPDSPGLLPGILSRAGPLPATFATSGEAPSAGRIYVAPPDHHMLIDSSGRLQLSRGPKENYSRPAIDPTFRSAALAFGPRLVGVILTGHLNDGASGLKAIALCGGLCLVQDPSEAEASAMPTSALRLVKSSIVEPLGNLALRLRSLVASPVEESKHVPQSYRREAQLEAAIAAGDRNSLAAVAKLGEPSPLTCPECHGALFALKQDQPLKRYRCHTGHAFTAEALTSALYESTEKALWSVARVLQEQAILFQHLAGQAEEEGEMDSVSVFRRKAERAQRAADRVREVHLEAPAESV